jgi:hypothetical protein
MNRTILIALLVAATLSIPGAGKAQMLCPVGYWPIGNGMCCPIGTVPVMSPYGAMQCGRP